MNKIIALGKKYFQKYRLYITYLFSAGLSFVLDLTLFTVILALIENRVAKAIIIASFIARLISSCINFLVNKYVVFQNKKKARDSIFQYGALVIFNITISSVLVSSLAQILPIHATFIKAGIEVLIFILNFFMQKLFIFKEDKNADSLIVKLVMPLISFMAIFVRNDLNGLVFNYQIIDYLNMVVVLIVLYFLTFKVYKKENNFLLNMLAIILTILLIIGDAYNNAGTYLVIFNQELSILLTLIRFIGYYFLMKNILNSAYYYLKRINLKEKPSKLGILFNNHPFLFSFLSLSLVYGLYLLFFYPGIINYDNANQIKEVLGLHTRYLDSIVLLNDKVTLTNFNPLLHTLLLGLPFKWGVEIGNINLGLFLYIFMQVVIVVATLSYTIYFLFQERVKPKYLKIVLLIYLIVPYFPFYAITAVKDTLFTMAVIFYVINLYKFIKYDFSLKEHLLFFISILFVIFLRNNGIYLILLSYPVTLFWKKAFWKTILLTTLSIIMIYDGYGRLLTALNIPNTSIREVLSIPFQQTARYVKYYGEEVTRKEKKAIDKILEYDTLAKRYNPNLSDKVKNKYNKYATSADLKNYFLAWGKMFFKHPGVYFDATLNNTYGYFYPKVYDWYLYYKLNEKLPEVGFNYHYNSLDTGRLVLTGYGLAWPYIPLLKLSVNCAFYFWVYLFMLVVLIIEKKKQYIILLLPAFSVVLMNMAGPANTYFRYCLPYAMTLPLILGLVMKEINPKFCQK